MRFLSLLVGKSVLMLLRLMGRKGSALPGLIVEKLSPTFLARMLKRLPQGVIVVTGTNGKTTTTKIITELLEAQGMRVLSNKTGSNFVRGTVTTVIDKARLSGNLPYDIAVFEQDEAHAVRFVSLVKPRGVVALNIMRDQMDRFGEIDTTAKYLQKVVESATEWVVMNANDQRIAKLIPQASTTTIWYGHSKDLQSQFLTDDELHHRDDTSYTLSGEMKVELVGYTSSTVSTKIAGKITEFQTPLSGSHNAVNLTSALAVLMTVIPEYDQGKNQAAIMSLHPAFGRGETIMLPNGKSVTLQLVKNPGGFTHALRMLKIHSYGTIGIAINDDYADGRDVSWLWDVDFGILENASSLVICGGSRGYDMAVRLKYDGAQTKLVELDIANFVKNINTATSENNAIIFCTYTAMLKIRDEYKKYSKDMMKVSV